MSTPRPESRQQMPSDAEHVFHGVVFDVFQWQEQGYDGRSMTFERLKRPDTAMIIAVTEDKQIVVIEEEQPASRGISVGIPCGRIEYGEDALLGAQRELLEETGYGGGEWSLLSSFQPMHKIDWAVYTFVVRGCARIAEQHLDGGEKIQVRLVDFDTFVDIILSASCDDEHLKFMLLEAKLDSAKMDAFKNKLGL